MKRQRSTRGRVLGVSMTELAMMLVFFLLLLLSGSSEEYASTASERNELLEYKKRIEGLLDSLGTSEGDLRKIAPRLVDRSIVDRSKLALSELINMLWTENRRLQQEVEDLRMRTYRLEVLLDSLQVEYPEIVSEPPSSDGPSEAEGTEPGSCWLTQEGRIEYFLEITLYDDRLHINPLWPEYRIRDLESLGIAVQTIPLGDVGILEFTRFAEPVYVETVDCGCRLFSRLQDETTTKEAYKHQRGVVERYFFVYEPPR